MRHLVVTLLVATMLAACGGSAATPSPASTGTLADERKDLQDFAFLIVATESPYGSGTETRAAITSYLATGIETNTLLVQFYFATGPVTPGDRASWERFQSSLTQTSR